MSYAAWSVVAGETPTASKWNILGSNDASFNDGTGLGNGTILSSKLGITSVSYTPSQTGFSAAPAGGLYYYWKMGTDVILTIKQPNSGTSNLTTFTIDLPVAAVTRTDASWSAPAQIMNSGTVPTTPGFMEILSGGTVVSIYKDYSGAAFTNSGNKRLVEGTIIYEAAS